MPTNPNGSWSSPQVGDPCKINALACVINDYCDWLSRSVGGGGFRSLSRDGVERLIDLAFYASLQEEEGRSPGFRLFAGAPQGPLRVTFDKPREVDLKTIRRLAPAIVNVNHALWVHEKDGGFESGGIVSIVEDRASTPACLFNSGFDQTKPGLLVRVLGPGHLRATAAGPTWQWKGGRLNPIRHFGSASVVRGWVNDLASEVVADTGGHPVGRSFLYQTISNVWSFIIESVVGTGHGGAFVIVPGDTPDLVQLKYPSSDTSLLAYIKQFWKSFVAERSGPAGSWRMKALDAHRAMVNEHKLRSAAQAMADLANVDGCVVFDRQLELKGFGGEIRVGTCSEQEPEIHTGFFAKGEEIRSEKTDGQYQLWNCPCQDRQTRASNTESYKEMGTRHRSAIRLCAALPGALAFVVSQDRALSVVFGEDPQHVWLWRSLDASSRPLDRA